MVVTWDGKVVESNSSRFLRPSPIITGFDIKEGQDQISRDATLRITAYTLEQMELIQTYFLEPGFSLFIEWGWNTPNGYGSLLKTGSDVESIVNNASERALNYDTLIEQRYKTKGEYDCILGFIVGGTVTSQVDTFSVDVKLKGVPSLPTYLQSYRNTKKISEQDGRFITSTDKVSELFSVEELTSNDLPAIRMFRYMFNELPSDKQLVKVRDLQSTVRPDKFVNFDKSVEKTIQSYVEHRDFLWRISESEEVDVGSKKTEILKENLFSKNKYIRMDLAIDILNTLGQNNLFQVGKKEVSFNIDINDVIIGAFPYMFSTDASKLLIPGEVPDFYNYFLQSETVEQKGNGYLIIDGEEKPPINPNPQLTSFVELSGNGLNSNGYKEKQKYYGYLKHLFVNFDLFNSKLSKKIVNIREVLIDLLNEMSSAVNAFWKFQIVEGEDSNGNITITVIDENWIGEFPEAEEYTFFEHSGTKSIFKTANLDMSLPASMVGQIVSSRLGYAVNPDAAILKTDNYSFFSADTDLFFKTTAESDSDNSVGNVDEELEKVRESLAEYKIIDDKNAIGQKLVQNRQTGETVAVIQNKGGSKTVTPRNNSEGRSYVQARNRERELTKQKENRGVANVQAYIQKLDIVPKTEQEKNLNLTLDFETLQTRDSFDKSFCIFCFKDADFFDLLKNDMLRNKYPTTAKPKGYSTLIPIKYEFTILGNSGIRRGDVFKVNGIPKKYSESGIFQVTEISHTLVNNTWETTVGSLFRQIQ
jgi:hypothetical protein